MVTARQKGIIGAWLTPVLMGLTPYFGKAATLAGANPFAVAAIRTALAAALVWVVYTIAARRFLYIFPAGLLGTTGVGVVNGLGSLLFYNGLTLLDASLAQLLYMLYFVFVMFISWIYYRQRISRINIFRAMLAIAAVVLLTGASASDVNWLGVGMMLGAGFLYALHVVLSQRVMFEMPAETMTIYSLTAMAVTVIVAWLIHGRGPAVVLEPIAPLAWRHILGLTLVTAASRLALFSGVKHLGGIQVVLLNVAELFVALLMAFLFFGDKLVPVQWVGAGLLILSLSLSQWPRRRIKDQPSTYKKHDTQPLPYFIAVRATEGEPQTFSGWTSPAFRLTQTRPKH